MGSQSAAKAAPASDGVSNGSEPAQPEAALVE